jgi:hypothetical protein
LSIDEDFWSEKKYCCCIGDFRSFCGIPSAQPWLSRLGPLLAQPPGVFLKNELNLCGKSMTLVRVFGLNPLQAGHRGTMSLRDFGIL